VIIDLLWVAKPDSIGIDARHYQRAASEWLAGGDPWSVTEAGGIPYAAGPHTLLLYVPTSSLLLQVSVAFWMVLGVAASVWLVRRLGLPLWWVTFPPLMHAIWNGNPQTEMLALLVLGTAIAGGIAAVLKLYAILPLAFHPRRLVVALLVLAVTLPVVPWQLYLEQGFGVGTHLASAWNGSAWRLPILIPPTLLALWLLRKANGEWYAVPAVFPATQFYYVSTALPAVAGRPVLAALLALPIPLMVPVVVMILAAANWRRAHSSSRELRAAERSSI
jgi:hypothetical protein